VGIALTLPFLVFVIANRYGAFAKWLRLLAFSLLRVEIFAPIGLILIVFLAVQFLYNLFFRRTFQGEQIFLNVLFLDMIFVYFLGLVLYGRFQIRQPSAILLKKKGQPEIYVYSDGAIRHIPDIPTMNLLGYSWSDVAEISEAEFAEYEKRPAIESVTNAKLMQSEANPEVTWIIFGDTRRPIPDQYTLDFIRPPTRRHIETVTEEKLNTWKVGLPITSIVRFR
jgi:hypothetical protein